MEPTAPGAALPPPPAPLPVSYIDWPAILAGVAVASAISITLLSFGSAIGLGFADFHARDDANPLFIGIAAGTWLLWTQVSSLMAGGYLTGRLRRRLHDATEEESDLRDGAHGLVVWAGAAVIGAVLALAGLGAAAHVADKAMEGTSLAQLRDAVDPIDYQVERMFRGSISGSVDDPIWRDRAVDVPAEVKAEARAILAAAVMNGYFLGKEPDNDRFYLISLVEKYTGVVRPSAYGRVDVAYGALVDIRNDGEKAERLAANTGVIGAFLLAASLFIAAIGAFWAAQKGGDHRDKNSFGALFRRF